MLELLALRHLLGDLASNPFQNRFYRQILDYGIRTKILHFFNNATPADLAVIRDCWMALIKSISAGDEDEADQTITRMILHEIEVTLRSLYPKFGHILAIAPNLPKAER